MPSPHDFRSMLEQFAPETEALGSALRKALASVMDESLLSSRLIAARLGVDKSLGWSCLRVVTVGDVKSVLASLPGRRAWRKVLSGLEAAGCGATHLEAVAAAIDALHAKLDEASLDRDALRAISTEVPEEVEDQARHLRLRKRFFDAARLMWGVSATGIVVTHVLAPSAADDSVIDMAVGQVVYGLERHRAGPPWTFYYGYAVHDGVGNGMRGVEGLGGAGTHGGLVEDLSSPGLLDGEVRMMTSGIRPSIEDLRVYDFAARSPRRRGPIRAVFAELARSAGGRYAAEQGQHARLAYAATLPTSMLVCDVLLHPALRDLGPPNVALAATFDNNAALKYRLRFADQLQIPLGGEDCSSVASTLDLPKPLAACSRAYRELIARSARVLGAEPADFLLYRTLVPHPPLPSTLAMYLSLPLNGR
ncbi:MAG: hypothetical protein ACO3SJ_06470 [Phycisphaerales bacterium]